MKKFITLIAFGLLFSTTTIQASDTPAPQDNHGAGIDIGSYQNVLVNNLNSLNSSSGLDAIEKNSYTFDFVQSFAQGLLGFAKTAYTDLSSPCLTILSYFFALWFLFHCIKLFFGLEQTSRVIWKIIQMCLLLLILFGTLSGQGNASYWNTMVAIPLNITTKLAQNIMTNTGATSLPSCYSQGSDPSIDQIPSVIGCMSTMIERGPHIGITVGTLITTGQTGGSDSFLGAKVINILLSIMNALSGIGLDIIFMIDLIAMTFMVIDVIVKLSIISSLAPIIIAFYFFKNTRRFGQKAIQFLLGGYIKLISCTFVMSISIQMFGGLARHLSAGKTITASGTNISNTANASSDPVQAWVNILSNNSGGTLSANSDSIVSMSFISPTYWAILAIAAFIIPLTHLTTSLLNSILSLDHFSGMTDHFMPIIGRASSAATTYGIRKGFAGMRHGTTAIRNNKQVQNIGRGVSTQAQRIGGGALYHGREIGYAISDKLYDQTNRVGIIRRSRQFMAQGNIPQRPADPYSSRQPNTNPYSPSPSSPPPNSQTPGQNPKTPPRTFKSRLRNMASKGQKKILGKLFPKTKPKLTVENEYENSYENRQRRVRDEQGH